LKVISMSDLSLHNHPITQDLYKFYPENRKLSTEEKSIASELIKSRVAPRHITKTINVGRQEKGHKGQVITKDIFNICTAKKEEKRQGRSEELILQELLASLKERDPDGCYDIHG